MLKQIFYALIVNSVNQSTKNRIDVLENPDTIIAINIRIVYTYKKWKFYLGHRTDKISLLSGESSKFKESTPFR